MFNTEVELVSEWAGLPGCEVECALNGPTDWILRYTLTHRFLCWYERTVTMKEEHDYFRINDL